MNNLADAGIEARPAKAGTLACHLLICPVTFVDPGIFRTHRISLLYSAL